MFTGPLEKLLATENSLTGEYLRRHHQPEAPAEARP
jgi:excinuclease UvrABC ATPase subunit